MKLSIIIPVYNEEKNLELLYNKIKPVLNRLKPTYEIIFIDDGSKDNSFSVLRKLKQTDKSVKIIKFRRNFGQSAALDAGFKHAKGNIIIAMDADLQNDPEDIPRLLEKLDQGYDVVSGWRKYRKDPFSKKIISFFANIFRKQITKEKIHDAGCTLKAYKAECLKDLNLYGELHRYIPTLLSFKGYKIGEIIVAHKKRKYGKTKYTMARVMKGLFDLLFIKFWNDYSTRPLHFFGFFTLLQYLISFILIIQQFIKFIDAPPQYRAGPIFLIAVMLIITGTLTFFFGFIAEILIRTYYKDQVNYDIEKIL